MHCITANYCAAAASGEQPVLLAAKGCAVAPHVPLSRDVFGDTAILGDRRWAGAYGVDADFVAGEHCSIARIPTRHIQARPPSPREEGDGRGRERTREGGREGGRVKVQN